MSRRGNILFSCLVGLSILLPVVIAAGQVKIVPATPPEGSFILGVKDLVQLAVLLSTVLGAVWFLATRIGKMQADLETLKVHNGMVAQKITDVEKEVDEMCDERKEQWRDHDHAANEHRKELIREHAALRDRVTVIETRCQARHTKDITGEHQAVKA